MSTHLTQHTPATTLLSPEQARARLVHELELEHFSPATQDELLDVAVDALMHEVLIAVCSWVPEAEFAKIETLAEEDRAADVQAIITKHVALEKIASIIDGVFADGISRYKELLHSPQQG